jgi:archaeosine synthase beta-subunit
MSPIDGALVQRVRRSAASFRKHHPLTQAPWSASSYPLAAYVHGRPAVKTLVWFPGPGCTWSEAGGCLMCNFGESAPGLSRTSPDELLRAHLSELDPATAHVHLGPGGSFYDDRETPPEVRSAVLQVLSSLPVLRTVGVETRPNLVTLDNLLSTVEALPSGVDRLILGFGLECYDDLLRELAVNKGYSRSSLLRAADVIARANAERQRVVVEFETYVLLKPPLLTEGEGVEEALRTIEWSFRAGASTVALFMNTIKDATVQSHLAAHHDLSPPLRYQTPYLRSAVEVLRRLPQWAQARTSVLGVQSGVVATDGPRGCDRCGPFLLGALYAHAFVRSPEVIDRAAQSWCPCRDEWAAQMAHFDPAPLHDRARQLVDLMDRDGYS